MIWLGDCQNEVERITERATEETRTRPSPPALGTEWMDDIFLEEEDMLGRGGGKFIFGFAEVFKASCFHGLGFCTDPLLPILPDQMCTNLLQMDETNLSTYHNSYEQSFLTQNTLCIFQCKNILPHKRLYEMQNYTKSKLFLRVILIILDSDYEKHLK